MRFFLYSAILSLFITLTGCAGVNQAYSALGASALVDARGAEDNATATKVVGLCMTPYDTLVRHPEIVPAVKDLCVPGGSNTSPVSALDQILTTQKK